MNSGVMNLLPAVWFPAVKAGTGTDVFTLALADGLRQRGIRVQVDWLPLRAEYAPWTVAIPKQPPWTNICHVNTWLHTRFIPRGVPVVATLHHSVHDPALRPYKGAVRAAYHRWWIAPNECRVMRRAQYTVAVSRFVADMARKSLCDVPFAVIHNGIDTSRFQPGSRQREQGEPFRLLFVGSWMARKGVDLLAPIMRELGEGFVLHYTGGDAAAADKSKMPPNMHDLGRLTGDQVVEAMQQVDALLFPSRSEGFGLVAAEAMACGLPVVATRGSSLPEVVVESVTGALCAVDDVAAFAASIRALRDSPQTQQSWSRAARARALEEFTIERMVEGYRQLYIGQLAQVCPLR